MPLGRSQRIAPKSAAVPDPAASTPPFLRLPTEIRLYIWELTVAPRTVNVRVATRKDVRALERFVFGGTISFFSQKELLPFFVSLYAQSKAPIPVGLHVCRDSRELLATRYTRAFAFGEQPRYVWVDFKEDTIDIGTALLDQFCEDAPCIRRLRFRCDLRFAGQQIELRSILRFRTLQKVIIDTKSDYRHWVSSSFVCGLDGRDREWSCGRENVWLRHRTLGTTRSLAENDRIEGPGIRASMKSMGISLS